MTLIRWQNASPLIKALLAMAMIALMAFVIKLIRVRLYFLRLERDGLVSYKPQSAKCVTDGLKAMPPHSTILGHLHLMISLVTNMPSDAHRHYIPDQVRRRYPDLGPIYYLDAWSFVQPFLVVTSPTVVSQYSQVDNLLPKHPGMRKFMRLVTGGHDLVPMEG